MEWQTQFWAVLTPQKTTAKVSLSFIEGQKAGVWGAGTMFTLLRFKLQAVITLEYGEVFSWKRKKKKENYKRRREQETVRDKEENYLP